MKKVIKQLLKAICYTLLFVGTQFIMTFTFMFMFMIKQGIESKVSGKDVNSDLLMEEGTNFILNNNNAILIISGITLLLMVFLRFVKRLIVKLTKV